MNLIERYMNERPCNTIYNWCCNNIRITNGAGELVPIEPTSAQQEIMTYQDDHKIYLLQRREGKTFTICMDAVGQVANNTHKRILIAVNHLTALRYTSEVLRDMVESSSNMPELVRCTRDRFEFANGCVICLMIPEEHNMRGQKFHIAYIDEFTHMVEIKITNVYLTLSSWSDSKLLMLGSGPFRGKNIDVAEATTIDRPILINRSDM